MGSPAAAIRTFNAKNEWLYIVLAAVLFALPILIYRYAVRRRPVESKRAMAIVLIYGAASLAVISAAAAFLNGSWIAVGAVLLWHIASYFILTYGRKKTENSDSILIEPVNSHYPSPPGMEVRRAETDAGTQTPEKTQEKLKQPKYCEMCGAKLRHGCNFCPECGAKVEMYK